MGEIAEDMIDGTCCQLCGMYFIEIDKKSGNEYLYTHEYPVVCWDCWDDLSKKDKNQYTKSSKQTL